MDASDMAEFDDAAAELARLKTVSGGAEVLAHVEVVAKATAQSIWSVAGPVLEAAGKQGIAIGSQALANFATSMLQSQIEKLSGR